MTTTWKHRRGEEFTEDTRGACGGGVCVVEAAGWRVCKSRQGQTGNDEVIAKRGGGGSEEE